MDATETKIAELEQLLWQQRDGLIDAAGLARIDALVVGDAEVRRFYIRYSTLCGGLRWLNLGTNEERRTRNEELTEGNDECRTMNDEFQTSRNSENLLSPAGRGAGGEGSSRFVVNEPITIHHSSFIIHHLPSFPSYVGSALFSYLVAAMILGMGLLVAWAWKLPAPSQIAVHPVSSPSPLSPGFPSKMQFVGRITGLVDCQWADRNTAVPGPVAVPLGRKYALASGLMEITYDSGAKVILQGPCTYEVESPVGGFLSLGKLTARVDKKTERKTKNEEPPVSSSSFLIPHSYFAVRTPTAIVTDLGTEFGVEVGEMGDTVSHVFRGSVSLRAASAGNETIANTRILRANESARVENVKDLDSGNPRLTITSVAAAPTDFVREIAKRSIKTFDLVDAVAGGDGFSGGRNKGIDLIRGRLVDALDTEAKSPWSGDGQYHRVAGRPFVDGVFVPNGPVQVDSTGHVCKEFSETANTSWQYIWAGGTLSSDHVPTKLGDIDYALPGHGLLYLNGNAAITFDLDAIRRANPGCKLLRFRSVAADAAHGQWGGAADIWVLVDGRPRFQRWHCTSASGVFSVVVPIGNKDRFLTLASTDGGDGISGDWILFGEPRLELLQPEKNERERDTNGP